MVLGNGGSRIPSGDNGSPSISRLDPNSPASLAHSLVLKFDRSQIMSDEKGVPDEPVTVGVSYEIKGYIDILADSPWESIVAKMVAEFARGNPDKAEPQKW